MIAAILMGLGAVVWAAGEVYAVKRGKGTTTGYVRWYARRGFLARASIVALAAWFAGHMVLNWPP